MPKNIHGTTKMVGLVGDPIEHSVSFEMHNAAFDKLKIDYCYIPFHTQAQDLEKALDGIRLLGFVGANITIPHKETIIAYLDETMKLSRLIGSVNTVLNQEGRLIGYNTDGPGFIDTLVKDCGFNPKGKRAVILGAGGASRSISIMLAKEGVKTLIISDIDYEKSKNLCEYINSHFEIAPYACPVDSNELKTSIESCDMLVNATPIGMYPKVDGCPIDKGMKIPATALVYDLIYNPEETQLLKMAKKAGAKAFNGIGMLVRQGALAFSIFTEQDPPISVMREAAVSALKAFKK
ncbi:shikimate dehydrogenase [Candidatus Margulisiibacteriota bacterium]